MQVTTLAGRCGRVHRSGFASQVAAGLAAGKTRSGRLLASSTVDRIRATLRTALADTVRQV